MLMNNINWEKAKGSKVLINGKWYTDLTASIFTQNFGHNNPYVLREIKKQLKKCSHAYGYNTEIKEKYLHELKKFTGYENILLFSTGAEAIEATIKIMINNGYECIGFKDAMHGRTLGAEALVGKRNLPYIKTYNQINVELLKEKNKAIFVEGYRGYDCKLLNLEECNILRKCKNNGNIIIYDEIQSGFYRTFYKFIMLCYNYIMPDITVIGKSMGGGFPLSAICYHKNFNLDGIELSSTHSGQPLQMAAGYGVLKYIDYEMGCKDNYKTYFKNIEIMNNFFNLFDKKYYNHMGMVGALDLKTDLSIDSEELFYTYLFERFNILVTKTGKGWIKIAPPVNINPSLLEDALDKLYYVYDTFIS